jgi:hypothetical protein
MKRRLLINLAALVVVGVGGVRTLQAEDAGPRACCTTVFTSAVCCGDACESGWFNCSATVK